MDRETQVLDRGFATGRFGFASRALGGATRGRSQLTARGVRSAAQVGRDLEAQGGAMLIIAMMVLTMLVIIGVTFAALMKLESRATENFKNYRLTELAAASAESSSIAALRGGMLYDGYTTFNRDRSPWIYGITSREGDQLLGGRMPLETAEPSAVSLAAELSGDEAKIEGFKSKIIPTSDQIYLNGEQDTLADILDNLGRALARDDDYPSYDPFYSEPNGTGKKIRGEDILRYRAQLGGRFSSKSQLKNLLGEKNYSIIADFVTAISWVDEKTAVGTDGIPKHSNLLGGDSGNTTQRTSERGLITKVTGAPRLDLEPHAPVNINSAPRPVLVAVLTGVGGRRAFPYVEVNREQIEKSNLGSFDTGGGTLPPDEEELVLRQIPVWVYPRPFTITQAERIADEIIAQRKRQPFKVWRSGGQSTQGVGFEDFVDQLDDSFFPQPSEARIVNPLNPRDRKYQNDINNPATPSGKMWARGHLASTASERRKRGLPYSTKHAWYYDTVRSVLKANFNPNTRLNKFNPNGPAYAPVDRSNLVKLEENDPTTPRRGYTTEFCFDANGIFEITTLAQMRPDLASEDEFDEEDLANQVFAEVKRRTVVKVWDITRHTTQDDFERPFNSSGLSSTKNRQFINTYPDAMSILHPDYFHGSRLDGRIELAGYADALRKQLNPSLRNQIYEGRPNTLLAHGFLARDDASRAQVARLRRRGAHTGTEYLRELGKVLDPEYSKNGAQFRKRYSTYNWGGKKDAGNAIQNLDDPVINTAAKNSDIEPDGLHTGMFRHSAIGLGFLRFPASKVRQDPQDQGQIGGTRGKNEIGNFAYYNGGVAFWVKFEFDPRDPTFSGLLGVTQVQTRVGNSPVDSEGTQFYVYKNTSGQLRITRLYYHQAFEKGATSVAVPFVSEDEESEGSEVEGDPQKLWARTDVVINLTDSKLNWQAHEWHHVAIEFNDEGGNEPIRVRLDHQSYPIVNHQIGEGMFCALNVEEPKDGIFVGAFHRDQAVATEGIFKFGTNLDEDTMRESAPSVKRVLANATIDEFTTFSGVYASPYGPIGYFTDQQGEYANVFEVPIPEGLQRVRLRSFTWSVAPPVFYRGRPVVWREQQGVRVEVVNAGGNGTRLNLVDAGGDSQRDSFAGRFLYAKGSLESRRGELAYRFLLRGATGLEDDGGKMVASPVLEDVTLTYYLPSAQVLVSEKLE